jgi:hypothetical protein
MVEAVPIVLQCPRLRIIEDSDARNALSGSVPARTSSLSRHTSVPQPSATPRKVPESIGPPGTTTAGRSTDAAAISSDGIVVAATEQHHPVEGVRAQHLLGGHRRHVPPQHRGRPQVGLAEGHDRQVERDTARLVAPVADGGGDLVHVRIARREVGRRVRDRDVRPPGERAVRQAPPHPGPVEIRVSMIARVPLCA